MKFNLLILSILFSLVNYSQNKIIIGETKKIYSDILNEDRMLDIYLPEGYEDSNQIYPVIYLLDSYYNFSHVVGTVEYLILNRRIPETIIVGIRNTKRNRDLTPKSSKLNEKEKQRMGQLGEADNFIAFLEKELFTHIEKTYKASSYKIIIGHSLGGLFNIYSFFKKPNLFNGYITISPSLWYTNNLISKDFESVFTDPSVMNISFFMTLADENKGTMRGNVLKLSGEFKNYINTHKDVNIRFKYESMPKESHGSIGLPSIYHGLQFIFEPIRYRTPSTKQEIMVKGGPDKVIEKTISYFNKLSETYGFKVTNEFALTDLGYTFLNIKDFETYTLKAFKINVDMNPNSYDAYSNLGMVYEEMGELQKAKENYTKALFLAKKAEDPEWEFYKASLNNIEKNIKTKTDD